MNNQYDKSEQTARFKVLSDPNRISILQLLKDQPRTVNVIVESLGIERTLVSHHLKTLRENNMVQTEKVGRTVLYRVHGDLISSVANNTFNFGCCVISFQADPEFGQAMHD